MTDRNEAAIAAFEAAHRVLFITGAGISVDSGLPTYRGVAGLYEDANTEEGMPIERALSGGVFASDPACTWKYIRQIESSCRGASPNFAHRALARLERHYQHVCVLTQNIDDLHRRAGSKNLIEIHGNVHRLRCTQCEWRDHVEDYAHLPDVPLCDSCGAMIRPEVVLFDEFLPETAMAHYYDELARGFDLVVAIGTTAVFPYIMQPVLDCRRVGRESIEINPGETILSHEVGVRWPVGAGEALRQVLEAVDPMPLDSMG